MAAESVTRPPARLRRLLSWQANKVNTDGTRLTAAQMPLSARADFAMLAALEEFGPLSQAELGRRLGLDRNDVNAVLNRLEDGGHVNRETDQADRRRKTVSLTDGGQRYLDDLQVRTDVVQAELAASLSKAETDLLGELLAKLLSAHPHLPS